MNENKKIFTKINRRISSLYFVISFIGIVSYIILDALGEISAPARAKTGGEIFFHMVELYFLRLMIAFTICFFLTIILPYVNERFVRLIFKIQVSLVLVFIAFGFIITNFNIIEGTEWECTLMNTDSGDGSVCYEKMAKDKDNFSYCAKALDSCLSSRYEKSGEKYEQGVKIRATDENYCLRTTASCPAYFAIKNNNPELCPKTQLGCITALSIGLEEEHLCEDIRTYEVEAIEMNLKKERNETDWVLPFTKEELETATTEEVNAQVGKCYHSNKRHWIRLD